MRVVVDTSTLISYVLTAGEITRQIMAAWRAERFTLLISPRGSLVGIDDTGMLILGRCQTEKIGILRE